MAKRARAAKADRGEWARGFYLLSDPTRLGVLGELAKGPMNVGALCKALGRNQPQVSHHLGLLRMGGLITGRRQGKSMLYTADKAALKALGAVLAKLAPKK